MKKLILVIALCTSCIFSETAFSQFGIKININTQPMWGPVGYDYVEYYYMPDIQVYYSVQRHRYIYMEHNRWVSRAYLPQRYRNYDVYHTRKVIINEHKPYLQHNTHHQRYAGSNDYSNQQSIRDSREVKYYQNKKHPEHKRWVNDNRNNKNYRQNQNLDQKQNNNHNNRQDNKNRHKKNH